MGEVPLYRSSLHGLFDFGTWREAAVSVNLINLVFSPYRDTSPMRNRPTLGPFRMPMPRVVRGGS